MFTFITNIQFLVLYDWRWIGKNVLDGGPPATYQNLTDKDDSTGAYNTLQAMIAEASELLMAAAAVGARYSQSDINTYGGQLLVRIVSDLALGPILKRRGRALKDFKTLSASYAEALDYLEQLRRGERIFFNVPNVPQAGLPEPTPMNAPPGFGPQPWTRRAAPYFGTSHDNNPFGGQ